MSKRMQLYKVGNFNYKPLTYLTLNFTNGKNIEDCVKDKYKPHILKLKSDTICHINLTKLKEEILKCTEFAIQNNKVIKWIIEVAALNNQQIIQLSTLIKNVVISNFKEVVYPSVFVKSSTGFYKTKDNLPNGATVPSIIMMLENASPLPIKAAGGVKNQEEAINLIRLGVKRIGTSSAKIISRGETTKDNY
jgi:deoxyribose-phosphate aldolase